MTVILLGLRGSGKTSVGRALSERRGWEFVDTDQIVTMRAGKSIREIFEQQGEPAFRDLEAGVLEDAIRWLGPRVIATGGGIVTRMSNRQLLAASGAYRIYLSCDPVELHRRITLDPESASNRPSLTTLSGLEEISKLSIDREPLYRAVMTHCLDVAGRSIESIVGEIDAIVPREMPADWDAG